MANTVYNSFEINDCVIIDESIKKLQDRDAELLEKKTKNAMFFNTFDVLELSKKKTELKLKEEEFARLSCRDKIEYSRLISTAEITTEFAKKTEQEVLSKNKNEQLIYIAIGSIVLLVGLYMIKRK